MHIFLEPSLLQGEQFQLSQALLTGEMLQLLQHLCGLALDLLQYVHVFLLPRSTELDPALQMSDQGGAEEKDHLP